MKRPRPIYLNPFGYSYPIAALASITHRITGVILFPSIAYLLWLLGVALQSPEGFHRAGAVLKDPLPKTVLIFVLVVLAYHLFAGVKHVVMDFHYWDSLRASRYSSAAVMMLAGIVAVLFVVWLW